MAVVEEALHTHLTGSTGVSSLVSSRVYPVRLPQNATLPSVTVTRVSGTRVHAMSDDDPSSAGRFQFSSWDSSFSGAHGVKEAVRDAVQRFRGTVSGVEIDDILLVNERALFETDTEIYQLQLDAIVHYQEST